MAVTTYHYTGPGILVGENRGGTVNTYRYDGWGSTSQMVDTSGNVTNSFEFDYFGNQIARTGTTNTPIRWRANSGAVTQSGSQNKYPFFNPPRTKYQQSGAPSKMKGPKSGRGWTYDPVTGQFTSEPFGWAPPGSRAFLQWILDKLLACRSRSLIPKRNRRRGQLV